MARASALQAEGQGFDSLILHVPERDAARRSVTADEFFDIVDTNEKRAPLLRAAPRGKTNRGVFETNTPTEKQKERKVLGAGPERSGRAIHGGPSKGARWMPWLPGATKDATSGETPGVGASGH